MNELCLSCTGYTQPNGCIGEVIDGKCKYYYSYFDEYEQSLYSNINIDKEGNVCPF